MEKITQELVKHIFEYKDGKLFWKNKSSNLSRAKIGYEFGRGSLDKDGYKIGSFLGKQYRVHRLIFFYHFGYFPNIIDHKDCNKENNNIDNLRECTHQQNAFNKRITKTSTSGVKGVHWKKKDEIWEVSIKLNNKQHYLGCFKSLDDAKQVAMNFREKHHGEFCRHE